MIPFLRRTDRAGCQKTTPDKGSAAAISKQKSAVCNSVNRKVNCEAANLNKTANASLEQVRDIEYISEYYGLESLPENLRQAARLRLEKPDASLTELGKMMDPPVSKSGVNHRFKKLKALADQMREKGGRL